MPREEANPDRLAEDQKRFNYAKKILKESVWVNKKRFSGQPCLRGHRFPVAQLLAELVDIAGEKFAKNFDIELELIEKAINGLAILCELNRLEPFEADDEGTINSNS